MQHREGCLLPQWGGGRGQNEWDEGQEPSRQKGVVRWPSLSLLSRTSEEDTLHRPRQLGSPSHFPTLSPWPRAFSPSVTRQEQALLRGPLAFRLHPCIIHLITRASPAGPTPGLWVEDLLSTSRTPQRAGAPWDLGPRIYLRPDEGRPVPHWTRPCVYPTRMRDTMR